MKTRYFGFIGTIAFALFTACVVPATARAADPDPGLKELQGTWKLVDLRTEHELPGFDDLKTLKIVIEGEKMTARLGNKSEMATFVIDSSKSPRSMDIHGRRAKPGLAIYTLDSDTLTIAFDSSDGAARPKEIPHGKELPSNMVVIVLQRER